jgi:hypothetical protein
MSHRAECTCCPSVAFERPNENAFACTPPFVFPSPTICSAACHRTWPPPPRAGPRSSPCPRPHHSCPHGPCSRRPPPLPPHHTPPAHRTTAWRRCRSHPLCEAGPVPAFPWTRSCRHRPRQPPLGPGTRGTRGHQLWKVRGKWLGVCVCVCVCVCEGGVYWCHVYLVLLAQGSPTGVPINQDEGCAVPVLRPFALACASPYLPPIPSFRAPHTEVTIVTHTRIFLHTHTPAPAPSSVA